MDWFDIQLAGIPNNMRHEGEKKGSGEGREDKDNHDSDLNYNSSMFTDSKSSEIVRSACSSDLDEDEDCASE